MVSKIRKPPIPHGTIVPIANRLLSKYENELAPNRLPRWAATQAVLKESGSGMFGDKELLEGPMQIAGSRNYPPLELISSLRLGMSSEEEQELQPLLNAIAIGLRPKQSHIFSRYISHGGRDGYIPPKLRKCMEDEVILWLAEEEKLQKYLDSLDTNTKAEYEKHIKSIEVLREAVLDPHQVDYYAMVPPEVHQRLSDLHGLILRLSKEYGGEGLTQKQYGQVLKGLARTHSGTVDAVASAHNTISIAPLLLYGTTEQKAKYLPKILKGESTGAFALTEPWSGTDAGSKMTAIARRSPNGKKYILNGAKIYTTNFHTSGLAYVMAKVDDGKGNYLPTAFIVELPFRNTDTEADTERKLRELGRPGREGGNIFSGKSQRLMTIRGSNQGYYELSNYEVPVENVLGEEGGGMRVAYNSLNEGRVAFADAAAEEANIALEEVLLYVAQREIFDMYGGTLADLPLIKRNIAEMAIRVEKMNAASELTAALIDQYGKDMNVVSECAAIKAFASEEANKVMEIAFNLFGGTGFMQGLGIERGFRDLKIRSTVEGKDEAMVQFAYAGSLRPATKELLDIFKGTQDLIPGLWNLIKSPLFKWERGDFGFYDALRLNIRTRTLGLKGGMLVAKHGLKGAMLQQNKLMTLGKEAMDNYVLAAAIHKLKDKNRPMETKRRAALEQYVQNSFSGKNTYPSQLADLYIQDTKAYIQKRIKEEEGLIESYRKRHPELKSETLVPNIYSTNL